MFIKKTLFALSRVFIVKVVSFRAMTDFNFFTNRLLAAAIFLARIASRHLLWPR